MVNSKEIYNIIFIKLINQLYKNHNEYYNLWYTFYYNLYFIINDKM